MFVEKARFIWCLNYKTNYDGNSSHGNGNNDYDVVVVVQGAIQQYLNCVSQNKSTDFLNNGEVFLFHGDSLRPYGFIWQSLTSQSQK
jgi:hypothetical protein